MYLCMNGALLNREECQERAGGTRILIEYNRPLLHPAVGGPGINFDAEDPAWEAIVFGKKLDKRKGVIQAKWPLWHQTSQSAVYAN